MYYVYVLQNEIKELYFGCTSDLRKRFKEHNSAKSFSTRGYQWRLVYYEAYASKIDAFNREKQIKYHGQAKAHLKRRIFNSLLGKS